MKRAIATPPGQPTKYVELTKKQREARQAESEAALLAKLKDAYKYKREAEYPPIGDQLDAILKFIDNSRAAKPEETKSIIAKWKAIKEKYPK